MKRHHIDKILEKSWWDLNSSIMSIISPYLEAIPHERSDIRDGLAHIAEDLMSKADVILTSDYSNRSLYIKPFREYLKIIHLLDALEPNSGAWNKMVQKWLIKYASLIIV